LQEEAYLVREYQNLLELLFGTKKPTVLFAQKADSARLSGYAIARRCGWFRSRRPRKGLIL